VCLGSCRTFPPRSRSGNRKSRALSAEAWERSTALARYRAFDLKGKVRSVTEKHCSRPRAKCSHSVVFHLLSRKMAVKPVFLSVVGSDANMINMLRPVLVICAQITVGLVALCQPRRIKRKLFFAVALTSISFECLPQIVFSTGKAALVPSWMRRASFWHSGESKLKWLATIISVQFQTTARASIRSFVNLPLMSTFLNATLTYRPGRTVMFQVQWDSFGYALG